MTVALIVKFKPFAPGLRDGCLDMTSPTPPSSPSLEPMILLNGVAKTYGGVPALKRTDLPVRRGEFLTLLGPSGSGKSTILNLIAGAIAPSEGRIFLDGKDITDKPARERGIGMVFQNYALMPHMTVFENIAYPLRVRGLSSTEITRKVGHVLERVGLAGFDGRKPRHLSGGQQQRVGIARCIVYSPSIILMDEPLGALDKKLRDQMQDEIKRLHTDLGTTIIYVTHDQEEALNLSDTICLLNRGSVAQLGTPEQLYFEPESTFVADFIGESNLFDGTLTDCRHVKTMAGFIIGVASERGSQVGQAVKVLVRPEKMSVIAPVEAPASGYNILRGKVDLVSFVGGMTRISLIAPDGTSFTAKNISERSDLRVQRGDELTVAWPDAASIVLQS
jgi:putative spermidine/putrescine transport system ATP-binding protein